MACSSRPKSRERRKTTSSPTRSCHNPSSIPFSSKQDTYTLLNMAVSATGGALSGVFSATGPILSDALLTGSSHAGPNAPRKIPGLGLVNALAHNRNFPNAHLGTWLYAIA